MSRLNEVHGLLSGLLSTFATAQSLEVKYEGVIEDPSTSTYLHEVLLPGEFDGHHLGPTAPDSGPVIYQVNVVTTLGQWGIAYGISRLFFSTDYFYRGRAFANAALTTRMIVLKRSAGPMIPDDTKHILPMSVTLRAYMSA